ncbi:Uncharacterised protein [Enterobacter cloacae]|uniref:Uncharacterized protein n=1 Tax=Enterobacter cloacae TaxID=550 RepID=A0A377LV67_ENTCL|nr:Uncharacterised protein [Enterobacter cloacae]
MIKPDGSPGLRGERLNTKLVWCQPYAENNRLHASRAASLGGETFGKPEHHTSQCSAAHSAASVPTASETRRPSQEPHQRGEINQHCGTNRLPSAMPSSTFCLPPVVAHLARKACARFAGPSLFSTRLPQPARDAQLLQEAFTSQLTSATPSAMIQP